MKNSQSLSSFEMWFKGYLKNNIYPVYFLFRSIYGFVGFYYRIHNLSRKLQMHDSCMPYGGEIGQSGWARFQASESCIAALAFNHNFSGSVHLDEKFVSPLSEIFETIAQPIHSYFGEGVRLDGIFWMETSAENANTQISSNWHTDNVGNRIKVFVCVEGDGSQPTAVIPNGHKRKLTLFCREVLVESLRWAGFPLKQKISGEVHLRHEKGSIFIFDTHNFHRGVYENSATSRRIFLLEFSNKYKASEIEGPIGTRQYNEFSFTQEILGIEKLKEFLDVDRLKKEGDGRYRYVQLRH